MGFHNLKQHCKNWYHSQCNNAFHTSYILHLQLVTLDSNAWMTRRAEIFNCLTWHDLYITPRATAIAVKRPERCWHNYVTFYRFICLNPIACYQDYQSKSTRYCYPRQIFQTYKGSPNCMHHKHEYSLYLLLAWSIPYRVQSYFSSINNW